MEKIRKISDNLQDQNEIRVWELIWMINSLGLLNSKLIDEDIDKEIITSR